MNSTDFNAQTLVRRSKLFVPVNREKFVAKAWTRNADCIILDLEDTRTHVVPAGSRKSVPEAARPSGRHGDDPWRT